MTDLAVDLLALCSFATTGPTDGRIEGGVGSQLAGMEGQLGKGFQPPWTVQILRQPAGQLSCPCDSGCPRSPHDASGMPFVPVVYQGLK